MPSPRWLKKPEERLDDLVKTYHRNLKTIATRMADHSQLEKVDEKHVDHAHEALVAVGLSLVHWSRRPQMKTTVGGTAVGLSFSMMGLVPYLAIQEKWVTPISWIVFLTFLLFGLAMLIWGWVAHP